MPYLVTFQLDAFNGTRDTQESLADLSAMLDCLIAIDTTYLRHHPDAPLLYKSGVRYQEEPLGAEFYRDIPTVLKYGEGDCLPARALVLRDDYTFAPIISLKPGDSIMEDGRPTIVEECVITGEKPVLAFALSNGCLLRASPAHRFFTAKGEEIRAEDVRVGQSLRSPTEAFRAVPDSLLKQIEEHYSLFGLPYVVPSMDRIFKPRAKAYATSTCVEAITEQPPELCADITTSTGRFYLPESDVIVHNCEDLACWLIAEKRVRFGIPARPIIIPQLRPNGKYLYHINVATPDVPGGVDDPSRRLGMK